MEVLFATVRGFIGSRLGMDNGGPTRPFQWSRNHDVTLEQLRIFVEVAQRQHITKTALALNMTQSAVSAAVTALETRHGILLFDRVGRSIVLNQTGRVFLQEALAVLARAKAAETTLSDLAGLMRGELSIMASQTIAGYWLARRLADYRRRYPGIALEIRIGNTEQVADAVEAGSVELGLVEGLVDRPALARDIVAMDEMVIVVAADHAFAQRSMLGPADFADIAWVLREPGSGTRSVFEKLLAEADLVLPCLDVAMVLPGNEAVIGAVEAGIGATLISRSAASSGLRGGLLAQISYPATARPFYRLQHRERRSSRAAQAFLQQVESELSL